MPVVASIHEFLETARKSNQVDVARLDRFLAKIGDVPNDPRKLAALLIRQKLVTTFQAEQFLLGKHKGFQLGSYRILDRLGAGGAGTVYLAEHQLMKRRAAIKVLPTPLADDPAFVARFRVEAQAAALLDHPNVVRLYDFGQENRLYFLVMEYVDGPNLLQLLGRMGAQSVPRACDYIRQAALGLAHAHEANMVHRDVKPANILLDTNGTIKVLDLGLARLEQADGHSITRKFNSNVVLGTADYLAPEQALNLHDVDHRADIYGLGGTLYALLTGRPPFHQGTIGQKLMWHQTIMPDPVNLVRPEIPEELAQVVALMLAKDPADRYQSMHAVIDALEPWSSQVESSKPSAGTMAEIRLAAPPAVRAQGVQEQRGTLPPDTWVADALQDTGKIETNKPAPLLAQIAPSPRDSALQMMLLSGLAAVVGGVVAAAILFLMWGPR